MNSYDPAAQVPAEAAPAGPMPAGEILRNAREVAGLSIDDVAQQLKLTPKQVIALERDDFDQLPGRTFVRGFARNYARLLHLDQQVVIDALPDNASGRGLDSPALHATSISIGELPSEAKPRGAWLVWAVAVVVVAGIAFAGWQYFKRGDSRNAAASAPAPAAVPARASTTATAPASSAAPARGDVVPSIPARDATAPAATPSDAAPARAGDVNSAGATATEPAALAFSVPRGSSWIEVRDATGKLVMSRTLAAGQAEAVAGQQPFEVVLGNAPDVMVTFNGQPVDLAAVTRANVARFKLP
jgi:cytoskeleton protein RodZ